MTKNKKRSIPILTSFLLSLILLLLLQLLGESALPAILLISLAIFILFVIYFIVAYSLPRLRKTIWLLAVSAAVIIYFGFLVVSLSYFKDLLEAMRWDPSMVGLGIAVAVFGFGLFMEGEEEQTRKENQKELAVSVSNLDKKILVMSEKLDNLSNVINIFLEEHGKARLQGKDNSENNQTEQ